MDLKNGTFAPQRVEFSESRVVFRSYNNANANGGMSMANANNDSSNANANIGSRLENNHNNNQLVYNAGDVSPPYIPKETSPSISGYGRKTEKLTVGWSLVGWKRFEEVRPRN